MLAPRTVTLSPPVRPAFPSSCEKPRYSSLFRMLQILTASFSDHATSAPTLPTTLAMDTITGCEVPVPRATFTDSAESDVHRLATPLVPPSLTLGLNRGPPSSMKIAMLKPPIVGTLRVLREMFAMETRSWHPHARYQQGKCHS
eukprot:2786298-Rhodomonas_salina.1